MRPISRHLIFWLTLSLKFDLPVFHHFLQTKRKSLLEIFLFFQQNSEGELDFSTVNFPIPHAIFSALKPLNDIFTSLILQIFTSKETFFLDF
jgi:hypothetical protein